MAFAVSIKFTFLDGSANASSTTIHVPNGFSIAQYLEFAVAAGQILVNLSDCQLTGASVCVGLDLSGATIKAAAGIASDIAQKAIAMFNSVVAGFRKRLNLPAIDLAIFGANSDDINLADANWSAFQTAMENGIAVTGGTISPTDNRDNDLSDLKFGRKVFFRT